MLVNGDSNVISEFLNELKTKFALTDLSKSVITKDLFSNNLGGNVDLSKFNENKKIENCSSLLEIFLSSLCRNLRLKKNHAAMLLTKNKKFLVLVFTKGIHNEFESIISLFNDLYYNSH